MNRKLILALSLGSLLAATMANVYAESDEEKKPESQLILSDSHEDKKPESQLILSDSHEDKKPESQLV